MATFFGSSTFITTTHRHHLSTRSSSQTQTQTQTQTPYSQPQILVTKSSQEEETTPVSLKVEQGEKGKAARSKTADSTDWIASSLTRRFGLGAGLAWVGFLAIGVVSEQIKTRLEVSQQQANTRDVERQEEEQEVVLPNGIRYYELKVGGGATPRGGDLVVINLKGTIQGNGQVFVDTFEDGERKKKKKKALALVMGSRPYSKGLCQGIETVLRTIKAGGKRRVIVPPNLAFGEKGADLGNGVLIPPSATLEYILQLETVSIPPA